MLVSFITFILINGIIYALYSYYTNKIIMNNFMLNTIIKTDKKGQITHINTYPVLRRYKNIKIYKVLTPEGRSKHITETGETVIDKEELLTRIKAVGGSIADSTLNRLTNTQKVSLNKDFLALYPQFHTLSAYVNTYSKEGKATFTEEFAQAMVTYYRAKTTTKGRKIVKDVDISTATKSLTISNLITTPVSLSVSTTVDSYATLRQEAKERMDKRWEDINTRSAQLRLMWDELKEVMIQQEDAELSSSIDSKLLHPEVKDSITHELSRIYSL